MSRTALRALLLSSLVASAPALAQLSSGAAIGPEPWLSSVPRTEIQGPAPQHGPYVAVPPDSTLTGEVKPFVHSTDDRTFRSNWSFADAVRFYDNDFHQRGTQVLSRVSARDRVTFNVRRPDGRMATVVVRNTKPTVIETHEPL